MSIFATRARYQRVDSNHQPTSCKEAARSVELRRRVAGTPHWIRTNLWAAYKTASDHLTGRGAQVLPPRFARGLPPYQSGVLLSDSRSVVSSGANGPGGADQHRQHAFHVGACVASCPGGPISRSRLSYQAERAGFEPARALTPLP